MLDMQREGLLTVFAVMLLLLSTSASVTSVTYDFGQRAEKGISDTEAVLADTDSSQLRMIVSDDASIANASPDHNFNGVGSLFVGMEPHENIIGRSWLKFNLSHVPDTVRIYRAAMLAHLNEEYVVWDIADAPIGAYYSANDTWYENAITWNSQPSFSSTPSHVIDSPASPNMFVPKHWYSWDVTADVRSTIAGDKILTEVLKAVNESAHISCWKYFNEKEANYFNASYLVLEYAAPSAINLAVDGYSTAPHIDYIMNPTPDLSWQFSDSDPDDIQKGYELDVYEGASATGSPIWQTDTTEIVTIYSGATSGNLRPFATPSQMRYQMKVPTSILSRTGVVDKLYFGMNNYETGYAILQNLTVSMLSVSSSADLGSSFASNYGGLTPVQVLYSEAYNATITDSWLVIDVQNTFILSNRSNLLIELRFMNNTGNLASVNYTTSLAGASVAYQYGSDAYTSMTAAHLYPRAHNIKIEFASTDVFAASTNNNNYPYNMAEARMQFKYNRSLIDNVGYVDRVMFGVNELDASATFYNLTIRLVETPLEGMLNETYLVNYGGVTPVTVLQEAEYSPVNLGQWLVFDVANSFYYDNSHDLLIEFSFDSRIGDGMLARYRNGRGGYRLYNVTDSHATKGGRDTATYELNLDFIHSQQQLTYGGPALVNGTTYSFRVKVCDGLGLWSSFSSLVFRYEVIHGVPIWHNLVVNPSPVLLGQPVTVSIDVEYFLDVNSVLIEYGGSNHSMSVSGTTYSLSWTPSTTGVVNFRIYMESFTGDWNTTSGSFEVQQPASDMTLLIVGAAAIAAILVVVVLVYSKRKK